MLEVNLKELYHCYVELKAYKQVLQKSQERLLHITGRWAGVFQMEQAEQQIKRARARLEQEEIVMQQMMLALERVIESYKKCENTIVEEYDGSALYYKKHSIGYTNLEHIEGILSDLSID